MENQKTGYIPLYRSILKQPWAKDVYLRTLWENLLLNAARKPYTANFKGHVWPLDAGQLVTTSADLGLTLCDRNGEPASRHAVERMLTCFEKEGMISVHAERRKGTLITILNYAEYAQKNDDLPAHNTAHIPAHNKASNGEASGCHAAHNTAHIPAHHEQEGNNKNKNIKRSSSKNSREFTDARLKKFLSAHPEAVIYTPSGAKWGTADDLKAAEWIAVRVKKINPTCKEPDLRAWSNDIRLTNQIDGRTHREICDLYDWASKHHFWHKNVMCPASLRKQWDRLTMERAETGTGSAGTGKPKVDLNNTDWIYGVQL